MPSGARVALGDAVRCVSESPSIRAAPKTLHGAQLTCSSSHESSTRPNADGGRGVSIGATGLPCWLEPRYRPGERAAGPADSGPSCSGGSAGHDRQAAAPAPAPSPPPGGLLAAARGSGDVTDRGEPLRECTAAAAVANASTAAACDQGRSSPALRKQDCACRRLASAPSTVGSGRGVERAHASAAGAPCRCACPRGVALRRAGRRWHKARSCSLTRVCHA